MREEVYDISGMHCAACSASVEKVTRRLPGVERSDVNLVAERMTIVYDENRVTQEQIIAKVEKAGFGAKLHQEKQEAAPVQTGEDPEEAELRRKKRELIVSAIFSCALLYVSMGQMLPFGLPSLPLPDLFSMHTHPMNFAVLQLLLAIPVLYCGRNFFINGFKALFHGNPNMDSLVAIGSACSFIYSVVMTFLITDDVHGHVHNLYYESAAVVLTLVSLGKFMESRNMKKTKSAITSLMRLAPDTAILADSGREVPTASVKAGDVLLVKPGARIPLDGVVTKGESSVNEAMLTGESLPVEKTAGSEVIGGSVNENGVLYVQVTRVGEDTTLSRIIRFVEDAQGKKAPISRTADKVAGIFVPTVIGLAVLAAVVWACYSILMKKIGAFRMNMVFCTRKVFFYGLLFMLPALFIFDCRLGLERFASPVNTLNLLYLGFGASALCFVTWNWAVRILGAVKTTVYIYLVPVVTVVSSVIILHETITPLAMVGTALTLTGLIVSQR